MTIRELQARGHTRIRLPFWANPEDYLALVWAYLYSPTQPIIGVPTPQAMCLLAYPDSLREDRFEPYTGQPSPLEKPLGTV